MNQSSQLSIAKASMIDAAPLAHPNIQATDNAEPVLQPLTDPQSKTKPKINVRPVLEQLFELYPHLFGAKFLPLKRGIYQDLMIAHPDVFKRDSLKAALGFHTRSTRYLQCVADGHKRYDLQGQAIETIAPEHVYLALIELFKRRLISNEKSKAKLDLRPIFRKQLMAAFKASGLSRHDYQLRVQNSDEEATKLLIEALDEFEAKAAKQAALQQAFKHSGKKAAEFAAMYGLDEEAVKALLKETQ